ncbi:MAG: YajQ family cyclic di-GMP-binding protein [Acidobacteriota bacterium]
MSESSFDIVSKIDMQEVQNALHQTEKEIRARYDFKGSRSSVALAEDKIVLTADDEFKRKAVQDILEGKLVKRGVSLKNLVYGKVIEASHNTVRQEVTLMQGIPVEKAREIVKHVKDMKMRSVQVAIQGEQLRVSSKSRDDLQTVIAAIRSRDFAIDLQFTNYRG